ncbi:MAG: hypothetical protein JW976_00190 [Syntrophaceae bacterium]|nr:hypothetical protein [Syntrophaceae bacterium]
MKLAFNAKLINRYKSNAQRARVLTEGWVGSEIYCPSCGRARVEKHPDNRPVADFYCSCCCEDFELKSKQNHFGTKILDGAHRTMLERLTGNHNPNLFLLNYDAANLTVINFLVIPKHFFVPEIIEKRKPLASTARRRGWTGCNILLNRIPQTGKIFLVRNREIQPKRKVLSGWKKTLFLREEKEIAARGWLLDVMRCVDSLGKREFSLTEVYTFEAELSHLHPDNRHIRDKIRQQLQFLRDKGYLTFVGRGKYKLT